MNKEYKQWKKYLATPIGLGIFASGFILAAFLGLNILFHLALSTQGLGTRVQAYIRTKREFPIHYSNEWLAVPSFPYPEWQWIYWGILLFLGVALIRWLYRIRISFKDINLLSKGSERFTTIKELKKQYKKVALNDEKYEGKSGIPVARIKERISPWWQFWEIEYQQFVFIDTKNTNSATIGATQSGKTAGFSYPTLDLIMRAEEQDTVIVNDLKGDMLKNTKAAFEHFGYKVYCLNLVEPENGIHYNPLDLVKQAYIKGDTTKAQMLANSLSFSLYHNPSAKEPMWEEASISLLNALILAVCEIGVQTNKTQVVNMYAVTSMLEELGAYPDEKGKTVLDDFFDQLPVDSVARKQYGTIKFSQGITRSGIFTGTMAKLKNYTYDAIAKLTLDSDFDLADLGYGHDPIALFIVYPDWNDSNYSIIATFLSQINEVLSERATLSGKGVKRRVRYLLEEAANIPAIDGLSRAMNVGLQRNLVYHLVIQSYAQLDDKYGEKMSKAITGACGNQIYILSDELDDAETFSKKLGNRTIIAPDRHGDPLSLDKSYGEHEEGRELLNANEMRDFMEGEWVVDRTKMRRDLKGNKIRPYPIFASEEAGTSMLFHYEYLLPRFEGEHSLSELDLNAHTHPKELKLIDYIVKWDINAEQRPSPSNETEEGAAAEKKEATRRVAYEQEGEAMSDQVNQMSQVVTETEGRPSLNERFKELFSPLLTAAYMDHLSPEVVTKLEQCSTEAELAYFCTSTYRPHLQTAFQVFQTALQKEGASMNG